MYLIEKWKSLFTGNTTHHQMQNQTLILNMCLFSWKYCGQNNALSNTSLLLDQHGRLDEKFNWRWHICSNTLNCWHVIEKVELNNPSQLSLNKSLGNPLEVPRESRIPWGIPVVIPWGVRGDFFSEIWLGIKMVIKHRIRPFRVV